jgi:hypothetical protein
MIDWASSDVDKLFDLAEKQIGDLTDDPSTIDEAYDKSTRKAEDILSMNQEKGLQCKVPVGRFIGKGGSNIRSLQNRTGTLIYQDQRNKTWLVYSNSSHALNQVKEELGY